MFDNVEVTIKDGHVKVGCLPPEGWYQLSTDDQLDILHDYVDGFIRSVQFDY